MALDPTYVLGTPLEEIFLSKDTGLPLAGGFIYFYEDDSRITAKPVFELTGAPPNYTYTALPNPITLSSIGTPQNGSGENVAIYYHPYDASGNIQLYYVVVKDSNGVEQFTREAWPSNVVDSLNPTNDVLPPQNQLSNSQFSQVFINPTLTTTFTPTTNNQEFNLAPDWTLVASGDGSQNIQIKQLPIPPQSNNIPTNPPYMLEITVGSNPGISSCYLRQRFNSNAGLWSSTASDDVYLSTAMVIWNKGSSGTSEVKMLYAQSNGTYVIGNAIEIFDKVTTAGSIALYTDSSDSPIPLSDNTDSGSSGYTDILIQLPASSHLAISSIQALPVVNANEPTLVTYDQTSSNRDQAFMGDYFIPRLEAKPIKSLITGWDFPLNPAQNGTTFTIGATPVYTWDQTIAARMVNDSALIIDPITGGLKITPSGNNGSFYLMQYLSGKNAKKILGTTLSVNINAYAGNSNVTARVYLYRAPTATVIPVLPAVVTAIDSTGAVTGSPAAGWTLIPRSGLDTPTIKLNSVTTNPGINSGNDYGFNGWQLIDSTQIGDTDKFAILVTFGYTTASGVAININSISLIPGDIPCRPGPQSASDVLSDCQYYFEKTYNQGVAIGTASAAAPKLSVQTSAFVVSTPNKISYANKSFGIQYITPKRAAPTVKFYAIDGTADNVTFNAYASGAAVGGYPQLEPLTSWTQSSNGFDNVYYIATTPNSDLQTLSADNDAFITYHYTADSRLGIVV